jgi:hypothetical protein
MFLNSVDRERQHELPVVHGSDSGERRVEALASGERLIWTQGMVVMWTRELVVGRIDDYRVDPMCFLGGLQVLKWQKWALCFVGDPRMNWHAI